MCRRRQEKKRVSRRLVVIFRLGRRKKENETRGRGDREGRSGWRWRDMPKGSEGGVGGGRGQALVPDAPSNR